MLCSCWCVGDVTCADVVVCLCGLSHAAPYVWPAAGASERSECVLV